MSMYDDDDYEAIQHAYNQGLKQASPPTDTVTITKAEYDALVAKLAQSQKAWAYWFDKYNELKGNPL